MAIELILAIGLVFANGFFNSLIDGKFEGIAFGGGQLKNQIIATLITWVIAAVAYLLWLQLPTLDVLHRSAARVLIVEGEFLGRESGLINVGGLKVMPAEIESGLLEHPDVLWAQVRGRKAPVVVSVTGYEPASRPTGA